ncbi:MAG: hypothetical protein U5J82_14870 [Desulfobacterales bacterium]|nr:hypothetical protein [Desulfobacterales bacterium]
MRRTAISLTAASVREGEKLDHVAAAGNDRGRLGGEVFKGQLGDAPRGDRLPMADGFESAGHQNPPPMALTACLIVW